MSFTFFTPKAGDTVKEGIINDCYALEAAAETPAEIRTKPGLFEKMFLAEPRSFTFVTHEESGRTAGFMAVLNLKDEIRKQIRRGNLMDVQLIQEDSFLPFSDGCRLYLYTSVVHPDFYGNNLAKELLERLDSQIESLKGNGIAVSKVSVDAWDAKPFSNLMKMNYNVVRTTAHESIILEKKY